MQLPAALRAAIEQELAPHPASALRTAAARLSDQYRGKGEVAHALTSPEQRAAYLAVRLPATYAAVLAALDWTGECHGHEVRNVLDLGCGPGTALWAAAQTFPSADSFTGIERNLPMLALARRLAASAEHPTLRSARWLSGDFAAPLPDGEWDLVICSYALNELRPEQRSAFLRQAWERTRKLLVLIEPGTKAGFANVLAARAQLLSDGAMLAAPCPHALACPMAATSDWCHFSARVERTADHRRLKSAELGHEDEKFSYMAFARESANPVSARLVRHPRIFSGYAQITLCNANGIENTTITRSKKEDWRRLKRLGWGDRW